MGDKGTLSQCRKQLVINSKSKKEEKQLLTAVTSVMEYLEKKYGIVLEWEKLLKLKDIREELIKRFEDAENLFENPESEKSFITPDGGFVYMRGKDGSRYPILISEVKNQGTNDIKEAKGEKKQSKGNAIERLGKNVIVLRSYMMSEKIFPFVCFGDGCDFDAGSTILDRVLSIANFGKLNEDHTKNENVCREGIEYNLSRGSFYFRKKKWNDDEMRRYLTAAAEISVEYYFEMYGGDNFILTECEQNVQTFYSELLLEYKDKINEGKKRKTSEETINSHVQYLNDFFVSHFLFDQKMVKKIDSENKFINEVSEYLLNEPLSKNELEHSASFNSFVTYLCGAKKIDEQEKKTIKKHISDLKNKPGS